MGTMLDKKDYVVYKSQLIIDNQQQIIDDIIKAHQYIIKRLPHGDSTRGHPYYNVFNLTSSNPIFYDIQQEMKYNLIKLTGLNLTPFWFQSWINFHKPKEVLNWHTHTWQWHGYFSIDPKNTKTIFEDYEISNEIGNVYIGPGFRRHKVEVLEFYETPRITLGFDITTRPDGRQSLIPL